MANFDLQSLNYTFTLDEFARATLMLGDTELSYRIQEELSLPVWHPDELTNQDVQDMAIKQILKASWKGEYKLKPELEEVMRTLVKYPNRITIKVAGTNPYDYVECVYYVGKRINFMIARTGNDELTIRGVEKFDKPSHYLLSLFTLFSQDLGKETRRTIFAERARTGLLSGTEFVMKADYENGFWTNFMSGFVWADMGMRSNCSLAVLCQVMDENFKIES